MSRNNLRILLVEDHPFQLIATQVLLNNQGYFLLTPALTAAEAMAAMQRSPEPYDLLLCGHGLARRAILLSGLPDAQLEDLQQCAVKRNLPLLGYLSKP